MQTYLGYTLLLLATLLTAGLARFFRKWQTALLISYGVLLGISAIFLWLSTEPNSKYLFTDFTQAYYVAGKRVLQEPGSLYQSGPGTGFVNIPIVSLLFVPFVILNRDSAGLVMGVLSILATAITCYFFAYTMKLSKWGKVALVGLFALNGPLYYSIRMGNTTQFLLPLLMVAIIWLHRNRSFRSGVCIAIATIIKPPLFLLGAYFLLRQRWQAFFGFVFGIVSIVSASLLLFGINLHQSWYQARIAPFLGKPLGGYNVQSVNGFLIRLLADVNLNNWEPHPVDWKFKVLRLLCFALLIGGTAWVLWRSEQPTSPQEENLELCSVLCLILIISPISWTHYYLLLLLPLSLYVGGQLSVPRNRLWAGTIATCAIFASFPVINTLPRTPLLRLFMEKILISHYFLAGVLLLSVLLYARWKMKAQKYSLRLEESIFN
jgi:hypothetical protein